MSGYISLGPVDVALAALLLIVNGTISVALGLGLERKLLVAALRTTGQLLLVGLVLEWVFELNRWYVVLGILAVMVAVAGQAAVGRTRRRYRGMLWNSIVSIWTSSWLVTGVALLFVLEVEPWYSPRYAIPLLGMMLGNALNGISLGLDRLTEELLSKRRQVDSLLALGATRWEAAQDPVREAVRTGMIPILNTMMVVGVVSLPGMMTGQLLAGIAPVEAVKYQIVIMFLIAATTALGTVGVVLLGYLRLFSPEHQLLAGRISSGR